MQGPAPFSPPPPIPERAQARQRAHRLPLWAGILIGALLTLVLAIGATGYFVYKFGWNAFEDQAVAAMNEQPIIRRCIGKIESSSMDTVLTGKDPREDAFAFHIQGPAGKGLVTAVFTTVDADHERIDEGELTMADGNSFTLDPTGSGKPVAAGEKCSG